MIRFLAGGTLCSLLVGILAATPGAAAPTTMDPCGGQLISNVIVSGESWLAICANTKAVSSDHGLTWQPANSLFGNRDVGPDLNGGFLEADGGYPNDPTIYRLDGQTGKVQKTAIVGPSGSALTVDTASTVWGLRSCVDGKYGLVRYDLTAHQSTLVAQGGACSEKDPDGVDMYARPLRVDPTGNVYVIESPTTKLVVQGTSLVSVPLEPFMQSGGVTVTDGGLGGTGWPVIDDVRSVAGNPDFLVLPRKVMGLVQRAGDGIWVPTGRRFATDTTVGTLLPTPDGRHLELATQPLATALAPVGDPQPADSAAMIDEANRMRAQVSLPPLIGDAKIAQAAHNHSAYWTLHDPTGVGLGLHNETASQPGFTGESPQQRCAAVGVACGAEVMYESRSGAEAVQGWIATAFHRAFIMFPSPSRVGAGAVPGGPATMDADAAMPFVGTPFGYPRGVYSGPLEFAAETPDPGCGSATAPYGTAVTSELPAGDQPADLASITVWERGKASPLNGCDAASVGRGQYFLPDDPLKPGTTYDVVATWTGTRHPAIRWSFTTAGEPPKGAAQPARKKHMTLKIRSRHARQFVLDAGPDTAGIVYRVTLQRKKPKSGWATLRRLQLRGAKHAARIRLKPGTYRAIANSQLGLRGVKSRVVRLR